MNEALRLAAAAELELRRRRGSAEVLQGYLNYLPKVSPLTGSSRHRISN